MDNKLATRSNGGTVDSAKGAALALPDDERIRYQQMLARLKNLITNGRKLTDEQAEALGSFATAEKLDPFTGECYLMVDANGKTMGPVVGIKGLRRKSDEILGPDDYAMMDFQPVGCPPGVRHAWECRLRDTKTLKAWGDLYKSLKDCGMDHAEIKDAIGPAPVFIGIGYFFEREANDYKDMKYNPNEKAKKRAEAAARKLRFSLPYNFGANGEGGIVEVGDTESPDDPGMIQGQFIEAPAPEPKRDNNELLDELGFAPAPEPEYIDPVPEIETATDPYADLKFQATSDPTTAFWNLAKRIGMDNPAAKAIIKEASNNFAAAFEALLRQAPPE